jgi:hypothetical protein
MIMFEVKTFSFQVQSQLAIDVLMRSIDKEIQSLRETMQICDTSDFTQYLVYIKAEEQYEELKIIKDQLENNL